MCIKIPKRKPNGLRLGLLGPQIQKFIKVFLWFILGHTVLDHLSQVVQKQTMVEVKT